MNQFLKAAQLVLAILLLVSAIAQPVYTQGLDEEIGRQLGAAAGAGGAGYGPPQDPRFIIGYVIRAALSLIGTVLVVLLVYAGFLWMTAGGNSEQIDRAKGLIKNSVIGLLIIFAAYSITIAIVNLARGLPIDYGIGFRCIIPLAC